ncbi:hypothetical protein BHM03_00035281 [Ensete ventricosum]|nr:hypothetical protein BHM03_00035281 [Ensete ventricosum]
MSLERITSHMKPKEYPGHVAFMHTPNPSLSGHTLVLFPTSGNVVQKSQDSSTNATHSSSYNDTQKWKGWVHFYCPGKSRSDCLQQIKRIIKALHVIKKKLSTPMKRELYSSCCPTVKREGTPLSQIQGLQTSNGGRLTPVRVEVASRK